MAGNDEKQRRAQARKDSATGPAGTILRASGRHGPQLTETRGRFWTEEAEALFLDGLATTCNVNRSAREAGFSSVAVYRRRRRDAGFADRWQAALDQGYVRLETELVRRATETIEGIMPDPETPVPPVTVAEAINLLRLHQAGAAHERARRGGGPRRRPRTLDDVRQSILVKLEAIVAMSEEDAANGPVADGD